MCILSFSFQQGWSETGTGHGDPQLGQLVQRPAGCSAVGCPARMQFQLASRTSAGGLRFPAGPSGEDGAVG